MKRISQGPWESAGEEEANSLGTTLQGAGTAHTLGTKVTLIASTKYDSIGIYVQLTNAVSAARGYLCNVYINDQLLIPNLWFSQEKAVPGMAQWAYFPVDIPAGSAIKADVQSSTDSKFIDILCSLRSGNWLESSAGFLGIVKTYGAVTGSTKGTTVDPGGTANTLIYGELSASTSHRIRQLWLTVHRGVNSVMLVEGHYLFHVAIGASSSEIPIGPGNLTANMSINDLQHPFQFGPFDVDIPAGSRLSFGVQCSSTDATDRIVEVTVNGMS